MSIQSQLHELIDQLILDSGEPDKSAESLVPPLERDPLLSGLKVFVQQVREKKLVLKR
jgi:hypothetical protein